MKPTAFDGLEYIFIFILDLFFILFSSLIWTRNIEFDWKECPRENYDRQNVAGHISNNDICVGDDVDVP